MNIFLFLTNNEQITNVYKRVFSNNNKRLLRLRDTHTDQQRDAIQNSTHPRASKKNRFSDPIPRQLGQILSKKPFTRLRLTRVHHANEHSTTSITAPYSFIHCVPKNKTHVILSILYSCKSTAMKFSM